MGMFSYICSKTNVAISSEEPQVVLYALEKGVVVEVMAGQYSGYGSVNGDSQVVHKILRDGVLVDVSPAKDPDSAGDEWMHTDWQEMVNLHFDDNNNSGMHAIIGTYDESYIPSERSDDDPNQGWGEDDEDEELCDECGHIYNWCTC